jgi:hypothetical protein
MERRALGIRDVLADLTFFQKKSMFLYENAPGRSFALLWDALTHIRDKCGVV